MTTTVSASDLDTEPSRMMTLANFEVGTMNEMELYQQIQQVSTCLLAHNGHSRSVLLQHMLLLLLLATFGLLFITFLSLLQCQQTIQYQAYLANQLKQQQQLLLQRSQSSPQKPQVLVNRQQSLPSLNDLCFSKNVQPSKPLPQLAPLPQQPCVSLQRRDSIKSDGSHSSTSSDTSASRYKTELCRPFEETGHCRYGSKCQFAHGMAELRSLNRHPRYKTEFCRTFHTTGFCSYGQRCNFIHNEDERRIPQQQPMTNCNANRPQALNLAGRHAPLSLARSVDYSAGSTSSINSTGSSPAGSVYGDASPAHSPSYLNDDNFSIRLSPTPSFGSDASFPSPVAHPDDQCDSSHLSPLDVGLSFSLFSKLAL